MKKPSETVFLFTLIDFLLQVCFFGLMLFVAAKTIEMKKAQGEGAQNEKRLQAAKRLEKAFGITDITELTDELTRMAPVDNLRGTADFLAHNGGLNKAKAAQELVQRYGGLERVQGKLDGIGKPGCMVNANGELVPLATVVVTDESIEFKENTLALAKLLERLHLEFSQVASLRVTEFPHKFGQVLKLEPSCRYTVRLLEHTKLSAPLKAVGSVFYYQAR